MTGLLRIGKKPRFLPTTREEMQARGWDELDILIVTGDAYVDHPAFGPILIARFLEGRGYKVGVIAQPKWDSPADIARMSFTTLSRHFVSPVRCHSIIQFME